MKSLPLPTLLAPVTLMLLVGLTVRLCAEEKASDGPAQTATSPAGGGEKVADSGKSSGHVLPKAFEEIVRMSEAGVSAQVLTLFVERSGVAYEPTGEDLIAMKQRGVRDEVLVAVLARSAAIRAEYEAARKRVAAPAIVRTLTTDGNLDPESYEFFWYHYAYPRALAGSYRTLAPYVQPQSRPQRHFYGGARWRTDGFPRTLAVSPARTRPRR